MIALFSGLMKLLSTLGCALNGANGMETPPSPPEGRPLVFIDIDNGDSQPLLTFSGVTGQTHWQVETATDAGFGSLLGSYEVSGPAFKFGEDSPPYDFSQWTTPVYVRARAVNDAGESEFGDVVGAVWGDDLLRGWTSGGAAGWYATGDVYTQAFDNDQSMFTVSTPHASMSFAFDEYAGPESPCLMGSFPGSPNAAYAATLLHNAINMAGSALHVEAYNLSGQTFTIRATEQGSAFTLTLGPSGDGIWNASSGTYTGGDDQPFAGYETDWVFAPAHPNSETYLKPLVMRAYKSGVDGWQPCALELRMPESDASAQVTWNLQPHAGDPQLWLKGETVEEGNADDVSSTVWEGGVWQGSLRTRLTMPPEQIGSGLGGGSIDLYFTYRLAQAAPE